MEEDHHRLDGRRVGVQVGPGSGDVADPVDKGLHQSFLSDRQDRYLRMVDEDRGRLRRLSRVYAENPEAERDLYQERLLQSWRSLPSFEGNSHPDTWLYRLAPNTGLQRRRSGERRPLHHVEAPPGSAR